MLPKRTFLCLLLGLVVVLAQKAEDKPDPIQSKSAQNAGDKAMKELKYAEALRHYDNAITLDSSDYQPFYKRATAYLTQGNNARALSDLDNVLRRKPDNIQAKLRRAKVHAALGDFESALADYKAVLAVKPQHDIAIKQVPLMEQAARDVVGARRSSDASQWELALSQWGSVLAASADSVEARVARGTAALNLEQYGTAVDDAMKVLKVDKNNIEALVLRGRAFYYLGEHEAASNHYRQCSKADPDNKKCRDLYKGVKALDKALTSAQQLVEQGQFASALPEIESALTLDPSHKVIRPKTLLLKCRALSGAGRSLEAMDVCGVLIDSDSELATDALIARAEACRKLGGAAHSKGDVAQAKEHYEAAKRDYNRIREKDQRNARAHQGLQETERELKISQRRDWYKLLGVDRSASTKEIKRAYRKMALEVHPDKVTAEERPEAEKRFMELQQAYETLGDDERRGRYDRGEDEPPPGQQHQQGFPQGFNPFGGGGFQGGGFPGGGSFSFQF